MRLLERARPGLDRRAAGFSCGFVAAVFLVHPQRLESVVWISERKDVLATLFWLLTLLAYVRYTELLREIDAGTARLIREQLDARVSRDGDPVE